MDLDEEYSRKPNLGIWIKNIPGNPTQPVDLNEEYSRKPNLAVDLDEEYSRKLNLWTYMKNISRNPTCGSEETVVAV